MKVLIVYAHPQIEGHCSYILENVIKNLDKRKIKYDLIDLYKEKYDPILHENELYTARNKHVSEINLKYQQLLKNANLRIFIYPIWWGSMPAILKGFFDKVLVGGFGFKYVNGFPIKLLKGKAIVFSTCGAPSFFYKLIDRTPIKMIKRLILGFCGIKAKFHLIGNCKIIDDKKKLKIEKMVDQVMKIF
jgi:NAD(P)H dehydrogenase (quinone)